MSLVTGDKNPEAERALEHGPVESIGLGVGGPASKATMEAGVGAQQVW